MIVMIDIIGAMIAGTMVVMTIVNSIFNVQQMNYNIQALLGLNTIANQVTEFIDLNYLESVGRNLASGDSVFVSAGINELVFYTKPSYADTNLTKFTITALTNSSNQSYISVNSGNTEVFNSLPFRIKNTDIFTYYDDKQLPIADLNNNLKKIFYIKVSLVFIEEGWDNRNDLVIEYPIVFWRFFKNIYLNI